MYQRVLAMINDQKGPLYQDMSWEEMATNLTSFFSRYPQEHLNRLWDTEQLQHSGPSLQRPAKEFFPGGCAGYVFPAFGLNAPACKENGECRTPPFLSQPKMLCEPDQGEGLGHWLQQTQCPPPPCNPDLPAVDTFQEGWGTYCEGLGVELEQYECRFFLEHDVNYGNKTRTEAETTTRLLPQPYMNPMPWISSSTHVRGPRVLPNTGTHDSPVRIRWGTSFRCPLWALSLTR